MRKVKIIFQMSVLPIVISATVWIGLYIYFVLKPIPYLFISGAIWGWYSRKWVSGTKELLREMDGEEWRRKLPLGKRD